MKPVFKCEYCNFMGTEEEVHKHELTCFDNYDRKNCLTCKHKSYKGLNIICDLGIEVPERKMFEFCPQYEFGGKQNYSFDNLFGNLFGGMK